MAHVRRSRVPLFFCGMLAGSACSAPPVSVVPPPPVAAASRRSEAPPPAPPRLGIATQLGPRIAAGRLALLQGRRVLLKSDGAVEREHVPAPWLLADLFLVPSSRGPRIVGADGQGDLVVFEDPLGAGRIQALPCADARRGVLPGTIVSRCDGNESDRRANHAVFLVPVDPGGTTARLPIEPAEPPEVLPQGLATSLPIEDAASASASEAAVILGVVGLVVTADGGASWRSPRPEGAPGDVYQATRLRVDAAGLHAVNEGAHTEALVDAARGTLGRFGPPPPNPEDEALWNRLQDLARVETPPAPTPHEPVSVDWTQQNKPMENHQNCRAERKPVRTPPPPPAPEPRQADCQQDEVAARLPIQSFGRIAHDGAAATTKLDWYDTTELGGAVHTWKGTLPGPLGSIGAVHLAGASPQGDHALFDLCAGGQHWLARVGGGAGGKIETALQGRFGDKPSPGQVIFGAGEDAPVAWTEWDGAHGQLLYVWRSGEAPRAIAWLPDEVILGAPTPEGVPLLAAPSLGWSWNSLHTRYRSWALVRVLPIPEAATAPSDAPPLDPAGWRMVRGYRPFTLPACTKAASGFRFITSNNNLTAFLDYPPVSGKMAEGSVADLRVSEAGLCIAGFFGLGRGEPPDEKRDVHQYGTMFVRADLAGGRAEMGMVDDQWGNMGSQVKGATCRPP